MLWHFSCFCALLVWEHITVEQVKLQMTGSSSFFHWSSRWCLQGHCCSVRFWNVFVIFTASKSTPVQFPVVLHPLLIIYCCKLLCWWPYLAPQQTAVYVWWLFSNEATLAPIFVCLFVYRALRMDYMAAAYLFSAHAGLKRHPHSSLHHWRARKCLS